MAKIKWNKINGSFPFIFSVNAVHQVNTISSCPPDSHVNFHIMALTEEPHMYITQNVIDVV